MSAVVGGTLTLKGSNFVPGKRRNTVFFKVGRGPSVPATASAATRTTITVTIPERLGKRLATRGGAGRATRVRVRVLSRRSGRTFTSLRRSPLIRPVSRVETAASKKKPCRTGCSTAPAPAPAPPPPAPLSPPTAPAPAGTLVFEDNFDGAAVDTTKWRPYTSAGHAGNGLRRPSAFTQSDGQLVITAAWDGANIVSGGMSHRYDQLYGSYEFRVRADPDPTGQLSGVVLTWPQSGRQVPDGEMDIWETLHKAGTRNPWYTFIHKSQDGKTDSQVWLRHDSDASQWHTVRMDWTSTAIRVYVDGVLDGTITDPARIPSAAHHLCLQLDAFSNKPLSAPVRMYVDWVRVYR